MAHVHQAEKSVVVLDRCERIPCSSPCHVRCIRVCERSRTKVRQTVFIYRKVIINNNAPLLPGSRFALPRVHSAKIICAKNLILVGTIRVIFHFAIAKRGVYGARDKRKQHEGKKNKFLQDYECKCTNMRHSY